MLYAEPNLMQLPKAGGKWEREGGRKGGKRKKISISVYPVVKSHLWENAEEKEREGEKEGASTNSSSKSCGKEKGGKRGEISVSTSICSEREKKGRWRELLYLPLGPRPKKRGKGGKKKGGKRLYKPLLFTCLGERRQKKKKKKKKRGGEKKEKGSDSICPP